MAGIQLTSAFPQLTTLRGIHMVIFQAWDERPRIGREIFNVYESNQYREHVQTVGGVGIMEVKAEGASISYDSLNEGFTQTFTHVDYAKGMRASRNQMRDELYGVMEDQGMELGYSAHATEETLLANQFNNGFNTGTTPDGAYVFSAAHVRENGEAYSNVPSSYADLSETALQQGYIDFRNQRDGGGKRLQIKPVYLIVAPDNQFKAFELTKSEYTPEDDLNSKNYLNVLGAKTIVWDYLTDSDAWFLAAEKKDHNFNLYIREEFWTEHIYDFDTKDYKISGLFSQSSGVADPRGMYGSTGS